MAAALGAPALGSAATAAASAKARTSFKNLRYESKNELQKYALSPSKHVLLRTLASAEEKRQRCVGGRHLSINTYRLGQKKEAKNIKDEGQGQAKEIALKCK